MRVLMTGGGTAGHVNPAIAIAEIIKKREHDSVIEFVGTKRGLESRLVPEAGYKLHFVDVEGLKRSLSLGNIKVAVKALKSVSEAKKIIREFSPDVVIGTGGYVCWPLIKAAASLGIPCALHEANAEPGLAVKMLSHKVDLIMTEFESAKKALNTKKGKVYVTGLPVKSGFRKEKNASSRDAQGVCANINRVIISFGGSLGAERLNSAIIDFIDCYIRARSETLLIHASGRRSYDDFLSRARERIGALPENVMVLPYINDMAAKLSIADLAITRAGASTMAELAAMRTPSILVPSPNVTKDQQTKNARVYEKNGAALLLPDAELSGERIAELVERFFNEDMADGMQSSLEQFDFPECDNDIYRYVKMITDKK